MIAFAVLALVLIVSGLFGWAVYRWRKGRVNWRIILGTTLAALLFLGGSSAVFIFYGIAYPSKDAAYLRSTNTAELTLEGPSGQANLAVAFAKQAAVGDDFEIGLKVIGAPSGEQAVRIQTSPSLSLRTLQQCGNGTTACGNSTDSVLLVDWVVTPTGTGRAITSIELPENLRPSALVGDRWSGSVSLDNRVLVVRQRNMRNREDAGEKYLDFQARSSSTVDSAPPLRLDPAEGTFSFQGVAMDLVRGSMRLETVVTRTLGVSERAYAILAFVGAALASGLGSGWLVSLFAWLRIKSTA